MYTIVDKYNHSSNLSLTPLSCCMYFSTLGLQLRRILQHNYCSTHFRQCGGTLLWKKHPTFFFFFIQYLRLLLPSTDSRGMKATSCVLFKKIKKKKSVNEEETVAQGEKRETYTRARSSSCSTETRRSSVLTRRCSFGCSRRHSAEGSAGDKRGHFRRNVFWTSPLSNKSNISRHYTKENKKLARSTAAWRTSRRTGDESRAKTTKIAGYSRLQCRAQCLCGSFGVIFFQTKLRVNSMI